MSIQNFYSLTMFYRSTDFDSRICTYERFVFFAGYVKVYSFTLLFVTAKFSGDQQNKSITCYTVDLSFKVAHKFNVASEV